MTGPLHALHLVGQDDPDGAPPPTVVLRGLACPVGPTGGFLPAIPVRQEMAIEEAEDLLLDLQRLLQVERRRTPRCPQR